MNMTIPNTAESNIFNIETPQIYRCNVYRYHSGLSKLYIRMFKGMAEAPAFYIFFADVGYFEGPMNWKGVNFHRASSDTCLDLMVSVGLVEDFYLNDPDTRVALAESTHLYMVQTPHTIVKIIAGKGVILKDVPEEIKR